jgi:hypothetical protein
MKKPATVPPITNAIANLLNELVTVVGYDDENCRKGMFSATQLKSENKMTIFYFG